MHTATWTTLKCLMLGERSQTQGGLHFRLYDILEKTKVKGQREGQGFQEQGMPTKGQEGIWGVGNGIVIYLDGGGEYTTVWISQSSQNCMLKD